MKKIIVFLLLIYSLNSVSQRWETDFGDSLWNRGGGDYATIQAFSNYKDSILFVTGAFSMISTDSTIGVTHVDSNNHFFVYKEPVHADYNSLFNPYGYCIIKYHNKLITGGQYWLWDDYNNTITNNLAYMSTDTTWEPMGGYYPNGTVYDFAIYENKLFIAGFYDAIGYLDSTASTFISHLASLNNIVAYNDTNYIKVSTVSTVRYEALAVYNGSLYAGGYHGLRRYLGGTDWETKPHGGVGGYIYKMAVDTFNNFLYVGGSIYYVADTIQTYNVAMWDGFRWHAIGTDPKLMVANQGMAVYNGDLYICSSWLDTLTDGTDYNQIARWDGNQWNKVGDGISYGGAAYALETYRDELYVGGSFRYINSYYVGDSLIPSQRAYGIARWYMPDTNCNYIKPYVYALADTFYLNNGSVNVQFFNNNAYVNSWQWNFGDTSTAIVQNPLHTYTDTGTFTVSVTVAHDLCTKTATKQITVLNPVGISSFNIQNTTFNIYPNPTTGKFTIETQIPQGSKGVIKIYGISGELITEKTLNSEQQTTNNKLERSGNPDLSGQQTTILDVKNWQKGTYICILEQEGKQVESKKFVVQ